MHLVPRDNLPEPNSQGKRKVLKLSFGELFSRNFAIKLFSTSKHNFCIAMGLTIAQKSLPTKKKLLIKINCEKFFYFNFQ
jgi:hypothetical protein